MSASSLVAAQVLQQLESRNATVSLAESCTGGNVAAALTEIAGASKVFQGGVVSYSNHAKRILLGVSESILEEFGAVSSECVQMMAGNVRTLLGTTYGVAISGVAGPDGGTKTTPVGTVYFSIATQDTTNVWKQYFQGTREEIINQAVIEILNKLAEHDLPVSG